MLDAAQRNNYGFTLLELMIVIGIIAVISGFAIPNFTSYMNNQSRRQAQDQVVTDLRSVQNRALTGNLGAGVSDPTYWGIGFPEGEDTYFYFVTDAIGTNLPAVCEANILSPVGLDRSKRFPENIVLHGTSLNGLSTIDGRCVLFSFENGNSPGTSDEIHVGYDGETECLKIDINPVGRIDPDPTILTCAT